MESEHLQLLLVEDDLDLATAIMDYFALEGSNAITPQTAWRASTSSSRTL